MTKLYAVVAEYAVLGIRDKEGNMEYFPEHRCAALIKIGNGKHVPCVFTARKSAEKFLKHLPRDVVYHIVEFTGDEED